jgi:hypothetical protein
MSTMNAARKCSTSSVTLDRVLQCYVLAALFSTSGIDVLLVMTLAFLLFASLRHSVALLNRVYAVLPRIASSAPSTVAQCR